MDMDSAFVAFEKLLSELEPTLSTDENEATTRLRIIDRVLTEAMGWPRDDIESEPHGPEGYADYLLIIGKKPIGAIEAKKTGKIVSKSSTTKLSTFVIEGPALKPAADGFQQAARYSLDNGCELAVLTTGVSWMFFQPFPGAGLSYRKSRAFVFPTLQSIREDFPLFYELLAQPMMRDAQYRAVFAKQNKLGLGKVDPLYPVTRSGEVKLLPQSDLAQDLSPIFDRFFTDLSADDDRQMLIDCFVETRESRHADDALEKLLAQVSGNVKALEASTGQQLASELEAAVETGTGENILIVGNKGSGKSTFVDRFFDSILSETIRDQCLVINIDLLHSSGNADNVSNELDRLVRKEIEKAIFTNGRPSYDELQGLYFSTYQRWSEGQFKTEYEKKKDEFKIRFGEYLSEQIDKNPHDYVQRLVDDAVRNRHKLPVFIFDNTDHHSERYQEAVFQWSQSVRKSSPVSVVILPMTDRTVWRLSKHGPFQTHQSKLFYLPVPSTRDVLERRVSYVRDRIQADDGGGSYFTTKGIKMKVRDIGAFAACMEEIFVSEDYTARRIGWLANHDVRRSLELTKTVITSPHMSIDSLVAAYLTQGPDTPTQLSHAKFMQALIERNYSGFLEEHHDFVMNIFSFPVGTITTPLLNLSILQLLSAKSGSDTDGLSYLTVSEVTEYLGLMRLDHEVVRTALKELMARRLIQRYEADEDEIIDDARIAITHSGRIHLEFALRDNHYVSQMAFASSVRSLSCVDELRALKKGRMAAPEWAEARRMFISYCLSEDEAFAVIPADELFDSQRQLREDLAAKWASENPRDDEKVSDALKDRVSANFRVFFPDKHYGFADAEGMVGIFVPERIFDASRIPVPPVNSTLIVDIAPGEKGKPKAIHLHSVEEASDRDFELGTVKFYNPKKGFGFVQVPGIGKDIYLSSDVLAAAGISDLESGQGIGVAYGPDVPGRGISATAIDLS